jgi:ABC-2 type transport system permease protein
VKGGKVLAIARTGLKQVLRDRMALISMTVLPLAIILMVGLAMGGEDEARVGIVRDDAGPLAADLVSGISATEGFASEEFDGEESMRRAVRRGTIHAGVIVPAGWSDSLLEGRQATVTIVSGPGASGFALRAPVAAAIADQTAEVRAAVALGGDLEAGLRRARRIADAQPAVTVAREAADAARTEFGFAYTAPSNLVLFVFLVSLAASGTIVESRRLGVTRRALATPTSALVIVAGFSLGRLLIALLQSVIIVVAGAVVFGVDWGDAVGAAGLVALFAVVSTAAAMIVGAVARTADQAGAVGPPLGIALGMLGGCMWPLEIVGDVMRTIGHLTPHAWAMDAWIELVGRDATVADIAPNLAALGAFAAVLLPLGAWSLRRVVTVP